MAFSDWWARSAQSLGERVFERRPFSFRAIGFSVYNFEPLPRSLPTVLAHHAQRLDDETAALYALRYVFWRLLLVPLVVAIVLYSALFVPYAVAIAGLLGVLTALVRFVFLRVRDGSALIRSVAWPVIAMAAASAVVSTLTPLPAPTGALATIHDALPRYTWSTFSAVVIVGYIVFALYASGSASVIAFAWSWLFTDRRITGDPKLRITTPGKQRKLESAFLPHASLENRR